MGFGLFGYPPPPVSEPAKPKQDPVALAQAAGLPSGFVLQALKCSRCNDEPDIGGMSPTDVKNWIYVHNNGCGIGTSRPKTDGWID